MVNFFAQSNFLDILIIIILIRICYISTITGLAVEFFKLSGILFSTYISLHYYTSISDIIQRSFFPKLMPLEFMDFLIFIILVLSGYMGFVALRSIFYRLIKLEAMPLINKFGGLILGVLRAYFIVGLLTFTLVISSVSYLNSSVKHSYLANKAFSISPAAYDWLWSNIVSKFSPKEKFNPTINEVTQKFNRK